MTVQPGLMTGGPLYLGIFILPRMTWAFSSIYSDSGTETEQPTNYGFYVLILKSYPIPLKSSKSAYTRVIMKRTRSGRKIGVPNNGALGNIQQVKITESSPAALVNWQRLPIIVQEAIMGELAEDYNRHSSEDKRCRAAYAAVDLQWQKFFEKLNFNKLVLRSSDLEDFGKIVKRRLQSRNRRTAADATLSLYCMPRVRHIWLCVKLLPYKCNRCNFPEEPKEETWSVY